MRTITEIVLHFTCDHCKKECVIGNAEIDDRPWYCPWCGKENIYDEEDTKWNT